MDLNNKNYLQIYHTFEFSLQNILDNNIRYIPLDLNTLEQEQNINEMIYKNKIFKNSGFNLFCDNFQIKTQQAVPILTSVDGNL